MGLRRDKLVSGADSIGLWAGLTVFFAGLMLVVPMPSWALSVKIVAVPFCVLLTQIVGRVAEDVVHPRFSKLTPRMADLLRAGLLLLPFVLLFAIFSVHDGMSPRDAAQRFFSRFFLCLMIVPGSLLLVQALVGLCDRPRRNGAAGGSRRGR